MRNMNREIKFRVWNKSTHKWVHGPNEEVHLFGECILLGGFMGGIKLMELNDCIALQYTGLKDKNGKEIYEGDIILCPDLNPPEYTNTLSIVEYHGSCWSYKDIHTNKVASIYDFIGMHDTDNDGHVIGNIFENPELI